MKKILTPLIIIVLSISLESCYIVKSYFKEKNPRHQGATPKFSEETVLLGELTKFRTCFDVHYYELALEVIPSEKALKGVVEIHATTLESFDTLQIDLHENFEISALLDAKTNNSLKYFRKERAIFILLSKQENEKFVLKVSYSGKPDIAKKPPWKGGFVWEKDKEGNHWDGVACESSGGSIWWPSKDHTSDEPDSMRLHYTVPKGLMAIGNGQFKGKTDFPTKSTYDWFISYPINVYNVTVYVGKFKMIEDEYQGINGKKLPITHYVLEKNYEKAKQHFQQIHPLLKVFEELYGEYPWYDDGFKLVEAPYEGMEHQTAIAYGSGYSNSIGTMDYIILHETAHEWWGNSVTAKDLAHVWLQEGFATYAEILYLEFDGQQRASNTYMNSYRLFMMNKYPVVVKEGRRWFDSNQNQDVYNKGAWILHTLRTQIDNDELFFDIIKTFAERYKYKIVESQDFIDLVNEKTSSDYNWFFNHYLYNNELPTLAYAISDDGLLHYKWQNTKTDFNKLTVKLTHNDQTIELIPSNKVQSLSLPKGSANDWQDNYRGWKYTYITNVLLIFDKQKSLIKEYNKNSNE